MLESQLVKKVLDALRALDPSCFAEKLHGNAYQRAGLPDIIGIWHGVGFGVELKIGKNKATPLQNACLEEIRQAGGKAIVAYSVEDVMTLITEIENEHT